MLSHLNLVFQILFVILFSKAVTLPSFLERAITCSTNSLYYEVLNYYADNF